MLYYIVEITVQDSLVHLETQEVLGRRVQKEI